LLADLGALRKNALVMCNTHLGAGGIAPPAPLLHANDPPRIDVWLLGRLPTGAMPWEQPAAAAAQPQPTGCASPPYESAAAAEHAACLDMALAVQFGFLAHRALQRSHAAATSPFSSSGLAGWCKHGVQPRLRVIQLVPESADGAINAADSAYVLQPDPEAASGLRPLEAPPIGASTRPASDVAHAALSAWLRELRVSAEAVVLETERALEEWASATRTTNSRADVRARELVSAAMTAHSSDAALVLAPLPAPAATSSCVDVLSALTAGLPPTVLCKSGGEAVVTTEI